MWNLVYGLEYTYVEGKCKISRIIGLLIFSHFVYSIHNIHEISRENNFCQKVHLFIFLILKNKSFYILYITCEWLIKMSNMIVVVWYQGQWTTIKDNKINYVGENRKWF